MDRWHGEGTSNSQPLLNSKHSINNLNSEYYIEDGSFFRIRNVQLAYSFDKALLAKIRLQALKVYVNIQNLKTWKHNTGYTPELGGSATTFGVDDGSYPVLLSHFRHQPDLLVAVASTTPKFHAGGKVPQPGFHAEYNFNESNL